MGETDLIYLLVGIGLGVMGSRFRKFLKVRFPMAGFPGLGSHLKVRFPMAGFPGLGSHLHESTDSKTSGCHQTDTDAEEIQGLKQEFKQNQLAYQMAMEMSQFKAGFLARTSHELRSPLSRLIGLHQLILSDLCESPEEEREFVNQANASAHTMVKLLDEVTAVAKTEHGTNVLEICSVPLKQLLEDVYRLTHLQAANRNLHLEIVPPDPQIHILADPRRFRQALVMMVDTSITQITSGQIKVWAALSSKSETVCIWIDMPCAISCWAEAVDLLQLPPDQSKQPSETVSTSSGLTLLMIQTLLEVMQGRIEVLAVPSEEAHNDTSAENLTRFQVSIPQGIPEIVEPY
ncbi:MAG: HAMP domain-containing histidine kinase [Moorea sp. SIO4E2]|uniref:sensor histidine kinase n=1 Tax=Moorena sp. SIO4E2 TaxID=2607826 RepID=UPI0013B9EB26|nr:HAMP domain-containing sensor histidine kinase [Moorena sp. SIO4E2]NEQ06710.1 HAMP domain-containing histidine kinase [Moorena sp. SIO4E2]